MRASRSSRRRENPWRLPRFPNAGFLKLRTNGSDARFAAGLADAEGLAFDADGDLFVADGNAGRVLKFHAPKPPVFSAMPAYTSVSPLSVALTTEPGAAVVVEGAGTVGGTADAQGTVSTDANGNFLLLDPPVGEQVVLIDGDPAGSPANRYPTIPVSMTIVANQLNELPNGGGVRAGDDDGVRGVPAGLRGFRT